MPAFPERESSILAKLKKKKGPGKLPENVNGSAEEPAASSKVQCSC